MSNGYYLPGETTLVLNKHIGSCKNLGLILDKYIPISVFEEPDRRDRDKGKAPWLVRLMAAQEGQNQYTDQQLAQSAYQRWFDMTRAMGAQRFQATLDWRMVVGLGGETVLETDLTLHHLYSIPYIPASALKGLTRAYAAGEEKQFYIPHNAPESERVPSTAIDTDHPDINSIFGSQERAGSVIFFDAMPVPGKINFVLDIMNPHYPDYYRTQQSSQPSAPTNDQNPNPVTFLTVAETTFELAIAPRNPKYREDAQLVSKLLQNALQKYGVGGKTSAGYGYFKDVHDVSDEQASISTQQPSQVVPTPTSTPPPSQNLVPTERIRPNIPKFNEGQEITGAVVAPTDEIRRKAPDVTAFLRYQSYQTKDVLIVVTAEEAQNWKPGETRICLFVHEEERDGCTVLVCQPRPSKKKKG